MNTPRLLVRARYIVLIVCVVVGLAVTVWLVVRPSCEPPAQPAPQAVTVESREVPAVDRGALALRDGRLYRAGETQAFSGVMTETYLDGQPRSRSAISNGVLEGQSIGWYTNGAQQVEEWFRGGVSHGVRTKWNEHGQRVSQATIVDGKLDGLFVRWGDTGALLEETPMQAGEPAGTRRLFYPSGYLQVEAEVASGTTVTQQTWPDRTHRVEPRAP